MNFCSVVWDHQEVKKGFVEIEKVRDQLLLYLKELLDDYHGKKKTLHYYDLIVGDWLDGYIQNIYTSWREINGGHVPIKKKSLFIVATPHEAIQVKTKVEWHRHLIWLVSETLSGRIPDFHASEKTPYYNKKKHNLVAKSFFVQALLKQLPLSSSKVLFTMPNIKCANTELINVAWSWRKWARWNDLSYPIKVKLKVDWSWRKKIFLDNFSSTSDFFSLVKSLITLHIPITLLESFNEYRKAVLALPLKRPVAVFSALALHGNLTFKILAAEWQMEGTKLLYHQHGGGYGLDQQMLVEDYEIRMADCFYSWGWAKKGALVLPLSPSIRRVPQKKSKLKVLMSCVDFPQTPYRLLYAPMPGTIDKVHTFSRDFLQEFSDPNELLVRPYPVDYGWGAVDTMKGAAPEVQFDNYRRSNFERYEESKLVVHNYLGTGWLETLALNVPTVCFYAKNLYTFRKEAQQIIEDLHNVGILHHSGKEASRFVNNIKKDPKGWWVLPDVQQARKKFVDCYARISRNWQGDWEKEFERVLSLQG